MFIVRNMVQKAIELYGRIDILINNAGIFKHVDVLAENAIEAFDQVQSFDSGIGIDFGIYR